MHAVLPHHHHESQVCFILTHCHSSELQSDSGHAKQSGNDANGDSKDCLLRQIVALPDKTSIRSSDLLGEAFEILSEFAVLASENLWDEPFMELGSLDQRDQAFSFPNFVTSSLGLRAPPAV